MIRTLACCGLALCALGAAESTIRDLTFDIEVLPAKFDYELSSEEVNASASDSFDQAIGLALGGRFGWNFPGSPHSLVTGAQLTYGAYTYDPSSSDYTTYGLRGTAGYGYAIADQWTLLAEFLLEYGMAEFNFGSSDAIDGFSVDGDYYRVGAEVRGVYEISDSWLANAHLGYLMGTSDLTGSGRDLTIDHTGPLFGIGISYRWSAAPTRLE
ncbi:MAG: hypothetical protein PF961_17480 [Planctomycetota bacterium]|jgi:hypothetical protein|nr:hypothetical protein [Planctomycetota bacterium]